MKNGTERENSSGTKRVDIRFLLLLYVELVKETPSE